MGRQYMITCTRIKSADFVIDLNTLSLCVCDNCQFATEIFVIRHYHTARETISCTSLQSNSSTWL